MAKSLLPPESFDDGPTGGDDDVVAEDDATSTKRLRRRRRGDGTMSRKVADERLRQDGRRAPTHPLDSLTGGPGGRRHGRSARETAARCRAHADLEADALESGASQGALRAAAK